MNPLPNSCDSWAGRGGHLRRHGFATPVASGASGWEHLGRAHECARLLRTLFFSATISFIAFAPGFRANRASAACAGQAPKGGALAAAKAGKARGRELLDLLRADLRRRHLRPHQRRDAELFGDGSARRLADAAAKVNARAGRAGPGCRAAAPAPRHHRRPAGRESPKATSTTRC